MERHSPTNKSYWGPRIWSILHTLSCHPRVGKYRDPVQSHDERILWGQVFKHLPLIMPCTICVVHYKEWLMQRQILKGVDVTEDIGEFLRGELYDLHCSANLSQNREPSPFSYNELIQNYPIIPIRPIIAELTVMFIEANKLRSINYDSSKLWRKAVEQLVIAYGLN